MVESSNQQQQQCPTTTTTIDENHGDHTVTASVLPVVVATRKMTSDTVIGSCMGGDPSILGDSSSDHHPPRRHSSTIPTAAAAYDGGSLSTHDEETNHHHHNDNTAHKHRNNNQEHRFTTTLCQYLQRCWRQPFSGHRHGTPPAPHGTTTTTDPKESHHLEERRWSLLSTAFRALLVRNMLYRRRNWISTLIEMCLPMLFLVLLIFVKRSYDQGVLLGVRIPGGALLKPGDSFIPGPEHTYQPMTFADTVTAVMAQKRCKWVADDNIDDENGDDSHFEITGIDDRSKNWQIPYVRCNSQKCTEHGEDATDFCEYTLFAIAGSNPEGTQRARQFHDWIYQRYPGLDTNERTRIVQWMNYTDDTLSDDEFPTDFGKAVDAYVTSPDYGITQRKISLAIVFNGSDPNSYQYAIRQNSTGFNVVEDQDSLKPGTRTTPKTVYRTNLFASSDLESCSTLTASSGVNYGDLGILGTSCTGMYMYNGVLTAQRLVHDFVHYDAGNVSGYNVAEAGVQFVQFPQENYTPTGYFTNNVTTPVLLALGLLYSIAAMISYIVQEKELRQKELLKMMSVTELDLELSWFITFMSLNVVTSFLCTLVSSYLFTHSDPAMMWLFWLLTFLSMTLYSSALAACSSKATRGILIGLLFYFSGLFLALIFPTKHTPDTVSMILSLHPVVLFANSIILLGGLDDTTLGLTSQTLDYMYIGTETTFRQMFMGYLYCCIFWFVASWYLTRSITPEYGQAAEVWYFPFTWSYWKSFVQRRTYKSIKESGNVVEIDDNDESPPIEPVSEALKKQRENGESIEIVNLRKNFGDKLAVNGLNMSMYSGQITALLGHNGAGKTTTINMITGALAPSSGTATIAGKDIRTHMPEIRRDVGICMQHDCLFPRLTVREHVEFFARLKGVYDDLSKAEADKHVDQAIVDVALWEKRNTYSSKLSGGMKRKLSVAIAFCAGSKVVILDEPTSGMDPFSRRFTWNVIRHYRQNRIIILTTHFMDEADILGDRIAIMSDGKLRCAGSSLFLKKIYGSGYQLTIEKNQVIGHPPHGVVKPFLTVSDNGSAVRIDESDDGSIEAVEGESPDKIASTIVSVSTSHPYTTSYACTRELRHIVTSFVPEATLLSDIGSELRYQLPMGSSHLFTAMFQQLDEQIDRGSMSCYGVSITTLDEVFTLVTRGSKIEKTTFASSRGGSADLLTNYESGDVEPESIVTLDDKISFSRHLRTLLRKRAAIFRRDKKAWLFTTILPSFFVLVGFLLFRLIVFNNFWKPQTLRLSDINKSYESSTMQNPIAVNSPDSPFMCQTPTCSHKRPFVQEELTNETYFFCGFQSKLGISYDGYTPTNNTCKITESTSVIDTIDHGGAKTAETVVANVTAASMSLIETSRQLDTAQYGAIWFTHESGSVMDNGISYDDTVVSQCQQVSSQVNYSRVEDCQHHAGLGFIIQYNFTLLHGAVLYQALADEAIVRHATGNSNISIETTIAPLPTTFRETKAHKADDAFTAWFLVVLSFPFISAAFATFIVNERASKAKHMQSIAGVEPTAYWISTFIWDIANYQIPFLITVMLMFAFGVEVLTTSSRDILPAVLTTMILYGPASAGFTYCVTFAFESASLCNVTIIITSFLIGMGGPLTCQVLYLRSIDPRGPDPQLADVADVLGWFLRWNPSFCLGNSLFNVIYIDTVSVIHNNDDIAAWDPKVALTEVYCLAVQSVVYILLAIQIDRWSSNPSTAALWQNCKDLSWVWRFGKPLSPVIIPQCLDADVLAEQELVCSGKVCSDSIVIQNLTKIFGNGKVAVNNLSLGVAPGECFGLLGINGAGKTTTMGLLTAEFPPTSGDAILGGFSITREPQKIRRRIGYCPQFCAHFENMTGREHIEMYAEIKGIRKELVADAVSKKLRQVGLSDYDGNRLSAHYSGGMKRRLSLACATIGQPQIIFLDECSTGVDPLTRRDIWQLVSDIVVGNDSLTSTQPAVILTTHSMEECEALCPRIGIMANGQLRCLGSAQHLKSKFGKGYQLELKVQNVNRNDSDFQLNMSDLLERYNIGEMSTVSLPDSASVTAEDYDDLENNISLPDIYFNVDEAKIALELLSGDDKLSKMVEASDPIGYSIWKDASSSPKGVHISMLVYFATSEFRMRQLDRFMSQAFPKNVLRERQETKARYEVDSDGLKISNIFSCVEENKDQLRLSDYAVSQTSLEQVFNMHAAEAERCKIHQLDG